MGAGGQGPPVSAVPNSDLKSRSNSDIPAKERSAADDLPDAKERMKNAAEGTLGLWLFLVDTWDPRKNVFDLWPKNKPKRHRLPLLDGFRSMALLWILFGVAYAGVFYNPATTYVVASQYALNSDLARDLLLLISGMCVTSVILAEVEGTSDFNIRRFYWRRFLALWPPLAVALLLTYLFDASSQASCGEYWWAVLLFVNNYIGDQECMPQTWIIAVLFQLYLVTPIIMFACVNYQAVAIRSYISGYILLTFLSILSIFISWFLYNFHIVSYSPNSWPPGLYFVGTLMRWAPYLTGITTALIIWDQSIPFEQTKLEKQRRRQNMPPHEEIEERRPETCQVSTAKVLDLLLDVFCVVLIVAITVEGTARLDAYVTTILRVSFSWATARLVFRVLSGEYRWAGYCLSFPGFFTASQLSYSSLILQALLFVDVRAILGVNYSPTLTTGEVLSQYSVSFLLYTVTIAAGSFAMYMFVARPILKLRPWRHVLVTGNPRAGQQIPTAAVPSTGDGPPDVPGSMPKPLQRIKSKDEMAVPSFGSLRGPAESTITVRSGTATAIETFLDSFAPETDKMYFNGVVPELESDDGYWVNTVVTAYNEGGEELADTLTSLHDNTENLREGCMMHVVVILDGWNKMSASMRGYLRRLYPGNDLEQQLGKTALNNKRDIPNPTWMQQIDNTSTAEWYNGLMPVTFTIQQLEGTLLAPVDVGPGKAMYVSCIIKYDNRRKHNSHEWFLRAFAQQYEAAYLYLTDVGTTSHRYCVPRLTRFMDHHPDFCASTGFQRTQKLKHGATVVEHLQREVQAYELGPSLCNAVKAAQGAMGYVVILSGPCQLVRCSDALNKQFLESFFAMINTDPSETGICHANMQLTEDVVFAGALYSASKSKKIGYVPDAFFNYDVEVAPDRFLKQRRRWHNGILGAVLSMMSPCAPLWQHSQMSLWRRFITMVVLVQQYTLILQYLILPSVYAYNIWNLLGGYGVEPLADGAFPVLSSISTLLGPFTVALPYLGVASYFGVLAGWIFGHNKRVFIPWFYYVMLVLSLVIGIVAAAGGVFFVVEVLNGDSEGSSIAVVALLMVLWGAPALSSLVLLDIPGLVTSIVNLPFFVAFIPMYILASAYGISRFADITWGNRPHESETQDGSKRDSYMKLANSLGILTIALYLGINVALTALLIGAGFLWDQTAIAIFYFFVLPYCTWAIIGLFYNVSYAARYSWCTRDPAVSTNPPARRVKSRFTSTTRMSRSSSPPHDTLPTSRTPKEA
mmetsp:Transcript_23773/g.65946  ORF Transcript_23773/g.65946 Transcript_23773/m.65946 type:complete len:1256 (-) Transcript_23773:244-4011(-)